MLTQHDAQALLDLVSRAIEQIDNGSPEQARGTLEEVAFRLRNEQQERRDEQEYNTWQFLRDDGR
jgi:hypothetical protein